MERWVKIFERLLDWEWADDPNMVALWVHLLLRANYKDREWHGTIIKRGQLVVGRRMLSELTGISERAIRTCLGRLKSTNEIEIKTTNKYSIITICKFERYQQAENESDQQTTSKRPANDQQTTTLIEKIEGIDKKKKRTTKVVPKTPAFLIAPEFEVPFRKWLEYKRQRRESYKSDMSLKACYEKLVRLANGDPLTAGLIVEQSIANNWAGLFELKDNVIKTNDGRNIKLLKDGVTAITELAADGGKSADVPF